MTFGESEQESPGTLEPMVVFWNKGAEAAMAYRPFVGSTDLTFEVRTLLELQELGSLGIHQEKSQLFR